MALEPDPHAELRQALLEVEAVTVDVDRVGENSIWQTLSALPDSFYNERAIGHAAAEKSAATVDGIRRRLRDGSAR